MGKSVGIFDSLKNIDKDKNVDTSRNIDGNVSVDIVGNNNGNIDGNISDSIIINKSVDVSKSKRISYYLNVATIKKIEQLAKKSNKGISEFLQEFLDATLDKIKIE